MATLNKPVYSPGVRERCTAHDWRWGALGPQREQGQLSAAITRKAGGHGGRDLLNSSSWHGEARGNESYSGLLSRRERAIKGVGNTAGAE